MSAPFSDPGIPVLTERHEAPAQAAVPEAASDTVLRTLLQAELEQAIEQATANMRARLEAELPGIVDRALRRLRPG